MPIDGRTAELGGPHDLADRGPSAPRNGGIRYVLSLHRLRKAALWLLVASGSLVFVEPSPYEALFALAALIFAPRLVFERSFVPLVLCLVLFNVGGLISLIPWTDDHESVTFAITSIYVSITAIFFASVTVENTLERLLIIRRAYIVAAMIGSIAGILGYFDIAGLGEIFTKYDRATGTFKDPNVLGPFAAVALVFIAQHLMLGEARHDRGGILGAGATLAIIGFALFLTFSRGAWAVSLASMALLVGLTFLTTRSHRLRRRIVLFVILGLIALALLLAAALTIPSIRDIFEVRASLEQDYDLGETGRFGNQWRSLPMLLLSPNGFGPLQFRHHFAEEDPHNVFINAFASYGWLGGFAYCALIVMTIVIGWSLVFRRSPLQSQAIAFWSSLFVQILQGFQIDTDHWRHLFLLLGCVWGLAAATRRMDGLPSRRSAVREPTYLRART